MQEDRLIRNIIDQMKEVHLKLGFVKESTRLYFAWETIGHLLDTDCSDHRKLLEDLNKNPVFAEGKLGKLRFRENKGRAEVTIPPEGAVYVNREVPAPPFLSAVIRLFESHHSPDLEQIRACFAEFGEYVCRPSGNGDFDYVLYFCNPCVDPYYYCVKMEMGHTIYHRFIKEDYEVLME